MCIYKAEGCVSGHWVFIKMPIYLLTSCVWGPKGSEMRWALGQHALRSSEPDAFMSWEWVLACLSGYLHHRAESKSCEGSRYGLKCTVECTENVGCSQFYIFMETHCLHYPFFPLLEHDRSLWVWCSLCTNDLAHTLLLLLAQQWLYCKILSLVQIFQMCLCLINYKPRQAFTVLWQLYLPWYPPWSQTGPILFCGNKWIAMYYTLLTNATAVNKSIFLACGFLFDSSTKVKPLFFRVLAL